MPTAGCPAARHAPSPNHEARPGHGVPPTLLVVHNISLPLGEFGGDAIEALFQNRLDCDAHPWFDANLRGLHVSAHFLIRRDGELVQFVSCDARAWHADPSNSLGREGCNDFSIGIELEGTDERSFEAIQYETAGRAHVRPDGTLPDRGDRRPCANIAPGRKTDPGPCFDWQRYASDAGLSSASFPYLR